MTTVNMLDVEPGMAQEFWPELEPFIARALEFDPFNLVQPAHVLQQVMRGFSRIIIAADEAGDILSASVVQLTRTADGRRVVHVLATAGSQSAQWLPELRDYLLTIARQEGATDVTMTGRPGWARKLRQLGFRTAQVSMRLPVDDHEQVGPKLSVVQSGG